MAELMTIGTTISLLKKPLDDLYDQLKSVSILKAAEWKSEKNIKALLKKIESVQKVKTIWQVDKEVKIKDFYYPSKIIIDDNITSISSLKKIPSETSVVIQGTVGQGKSIFIRYLCLQELRSGSRVPIFFELRRLDYNKGLKENIIDVFNSLDFDINEELFEYFAKSGKFVLLLDGFDEIDPIYVSKIISELEFLSMSYPKLQIVVTSRPDSGIEKSAYFRIYKLAPLTNDDHEEFLRKLIGKNEEQIQNILSSIRSSKTELIALLTTPLLMTLLVIIYNAYQKIPEQFSEFYEHLFQTMLLRHDNSKPGYKRKRFTKINERKLQDVFEAFCFFSSKDSLTSMKFDKMHSLSEMAIKDVAVECDSSDFIKDISKIACVVIEEGFDYHFIHKSIREYYAANYVAKRNDGFSTLFYGKMLEGVFLKWKPELYFLTQLDEYRCAKFFLIPYLKETLDKVGYLEGNGMINNIKNEKILSSCFVFVDMESGGCHQFQYMHNSFFDEEKILIDGICDLLLSHSFKIDGDSKKEYILEKAKEKSIGIEYEYMGFSSGRNAYKLKAIDYIEIVSNEKKVLNKIKLSYKKLHDIYLDKLQIISLEDGKKDQLVF